MNNYLIIAGVLTIIILGSLVYEFYLQPKEIKKKLLEDAKQKISALILSLMYTARESFKDGEGTFKRSYVINLVLNSQFYINLPIIIKLFINEAYLTSLINNLYDKHIKKK